MMMTKTDLETTLMAHAAWLADDATGERAVLRGANLRGANLTGADLCDADLSGADLTGAQIYPGWHLTRD